MGTLQVGVPQQLQEKELALAQQASGGRKLPGRFSPQLPWGGVEGKEHLPPVLSVLVPF